MNVIRRSISSHQMLATRRGRERLALLCFMLVFFLFYHVPPSIKSLTTTSSSSKTEPVALNSSKEAKIDNETRFILYYTTYWNQPDFQFGTGRQPFLEYNCPVHNCWIQSIRESFLRTKMAAATGANQTTNLPPSLGVAPIHNFSQFDAVLVSVQSHDNFDLGNEDIRQDIESWRQAHQRFVFFMMESQTFPIHNLRAMNGFFNWTMTFRWDSTIARPYGWFEELAGRNRFHSNVYPSQPDQWVPYNEENFRHTLSSRPQSFWNLAKRQGKVAWIVSHCSTESRREDYVYQLRQYIQVDEFGGRCQRRDSSICDTPYSISNGKPYDNCTRHVQQHYKFYLALENQFCDDYVTEKFFQRMEHSVVITLGQANYSAIAPPHSSISIFDFETARDLAAYLHHLDRNDMDYLSYFWWKDYYRVRYPRSDHAGRNNFGLSMCQLCEKLHDPQEPTHVYQDIFQWWRGSANCGMRLHGFKARMADDPGLSGFRSDGRNSGNLAMFTRKHPQMSDHLSLRHLQVKMNITMR